jgi:ABC-type polysaccharide/polyol phosphate export permease
MDEAPVEKHLRPMWKTNSLLASPITIVRENLQHRELIRRLIRRDLDAKFRGPWLGYLWAIIEPLLLALVYSFVFGIIVGRSDPHYPAIVMIGVIGWSLFAKSLTGTTKTLTSNAGLFNFTKIPKSVFAVSGMLTNYILSFISLLALIPFLIYYEINVGLSILLVPLCLILLGLTGTAFGLILAPFAVRIPDLVNIVQFLARVGFFLSPVMWTYPMLSNKFGTGEFLILAHLNPVIVPITLMRDFILSSSSEIPEYGYIMFASLSILVFITGTIVFRRMAHKMVVGL